MPASAPGKGIEYEYSDHWHSLVIISICAPGSWHILVAASQTTAALPLNYRRTGSSQLARYHLTNKNICFNLLLHLNNVCRLWSKVVGHVKALAHRSCIISSCPSGRKMPVVHLVGETPDLVVPDLTVLELVAGPKARRGLSGLRELSKVNPPAENQCWQLNPWTFQVT
jgi:hypothetical protein